MYNLHPSFRPGPIVFRPRMTVGATVSLLLNFIKKSFNALSLSGASARQVHRSRNYNAAEQCNFSDSFGATIDVTLQVNHDTGKQYVALDKEKKLCTRCLVFALNIAVLLSHFQPMAIYERYFSLRFY